jgi:hypothetical protein
LLRFIDSKQVTRDFRGSVEVNREFLQFGFRLSFANSHLLMSIVNTGCCNGPVIVALRADCVELTVKPAMFVPLDYFELNFGSHPI